MAEPLAFTYEPLITRIGCGRTRVMVQLFRSPTTGEILHAQLCVETPTGGWGTPYQLEAYTHDGNSAV